MLATLRNRQQCFDEAISRHNSAVAVEPTARRSLDYRSNIQRRLIRQPPGGRTCQKTISPRKLINIQNTKSIHNVNTTIYQKICLILIFAIVFGCGML